MIGFVTLYAVPAVSVKYDCRFCNENFYCSALEMEEKNVDERIRLSRQIKQRTHKKKRFGFSINRPYHGFDE